MNYEKMFEEATGEKAIIPDDGANEQYNSLYVEYLETKLDMIGKYSAHNICKIIAETQPIPDMDLTKCFPPEGYRLSFVSAVENPEKECEMKEVVETEETK